MKKAKVIAIANHKGGVAKTTTTASVGYILAKKGYKVLLVDLDAQANLTECMSKEDLSDHCIYYVLTGRSEHIDVVQLSENLSIIPSSILLSKATMEMAGMISREMRLKELLKPIKGDYDFIILDCPPSELGIILLNALTAADDVIVPLVAEVLPFKGFSMLIDFINKIPKHLNSKIRLTGVLITRWENSSLSVNIEEGVRKQLGDKVFQTKIRKNVRLAETPLESKNIIEYAPKSNGAKDYMAFTEELLEKFGYKE